MKLTFEQRVSKDPIVSLEMMQIVGKALCDYHHALAPHPQLQATFDAAVNYAMDARFEHPYKVVIESLDFEHMPRLSRVQAQLHLIGSMVDQWYKKQTSDVEQELSNARPTDTRGIQDKTAFKDGVLKLCAAIDHTLEISVQARAGLHTR